MTVVNLDPYHPQEAVLDLDLTVLGLPRDAPYPVVDELTGEHYSWFGSRPYVRLDPSTRAAHVLDLRPSPW